MELNNISKCMFITFTNKINYSYISISYTINNAGLKRSVNKTFSFIMRHTYTRDFINFDAIIVLYFLPVASIM